MQYEDPITKLTTEATRQARLYNDLFRDQSALAQFAREAQAHAKLMESIQGPQWMQDIQRFAQNDRFTRFAREAQEQMRLLQDSNVLKFMKEAQAAARQFDDSGIVKTLRVAETQRRLIEATSGFAKVAQAVQKMMAEPAVMKMVREAANTAALYRTLGLDITQMAATIPQFAAEGLVSATAELEVIQAGIVALPEQRDSKLVAESFQRLVQTLESLLDGVRSPVERKTVIKFLGWIIPIVLMLWLAYAQHEDAVESQRANDRNATVAHQDSQNIERAIEKLTERYDSAQAQDDHVQYYDVLRLVPLCTARKLHGENLFVILPGSVVQLLDRQGKWIKVCAISPSGDTATGWLLKKYLRRQER